MVVEERYCLNPYETKHRCYDRSARWPFAAGGAPTTESRVETGHRHTTRGKAVSADIAEAGGE